jgi:hypothetical protein
MAGRDYRGLPGPADSTDGTHDTSSRKMKSVSYLIKSSRLIGRISSVSKLKLSANFLVSVIRKLRQIESFHHDAVISPKSGSSAYDCHVWLSERFLSLSGAEKIRTGRPENKVSISLLTQVCLATTAS